MKSLKRKLHEMKEIHNALRIYDLSTVFILILALWVSIEKNLVFGTGLILLVMALVYYREIIIMKILTNGKEEY